tara:strand:- start:312 stop:416 length:105 start_codon:yes stop_codon:yes gene_type:complete
MMELWDTVEATKGLPAEVGTLSGLTLTLTLTLTS